MKLFPGWQVWLLACISLVFCQDDIGTKDATKGSTMPEQTNMRDLGLTTFQKPTSPIGEEQIEDELTNSPTTTEKIAEKRKFTIRPSKDSGEPREIFTPKINETGPPTIRTSLSSSTKKFKALLSSSLNKSDTPNTASEDEVDSTTAFDGLTRKSLGDNTERKNRQRLDGLKGVTTNRGKARFQNEPGTETPEIVTTQRHRRPTRLKVTEQSFKDDIGSTLMNDDTFETTTIIDTSEDEQRPKFKKPPLIATHHPNFGTTTESSRRPNLRLNLNLKHKISSSTHRTRLPELDIVESEIVVPTNKTQESLTSIQSNSIRPVKLSAQKASVAHQQPIPPTATAWALASLKAPNNTNRVFKKPLNLTSVQEQIQITKIKPFVTWSSRLQKNNEENATTTTASNLLRTTELNDISTGASLRETSTNLSSTTSIPITVSTITTTTVENSLEDRIANVNETVVKISGGDTDQNKYEVYGTQKPEVENTTTVIETLRPPTPTTSSESQESSLYLVTSYKSILENNGTSESPAKIFSSLESSSSEGTTFKYPGVSENVFISSSTDRSRVEPSSEQMPTSVERETSSEVSKDLGNTTSSELSEYSESSEEPLANNATTTTTTEKQASSSSAGFEFSDVSLDHQNHSTTTEKYLEKIKTKVDDKITESTNSQDSYEMVDYTHLFTSERPASSTENENQTKSASEKLSSEATSQINDERQTSSQVPPSWSYVPDAFAFSDFDFNNNDSHEDTGEEFQKNVEASSQSSVTLSEQTPELDLSENDVPMFASSTTTTTTTPSSPSSSSTTTTTSTTTPSPETTQTPTTTTSSTTTTTTTTTTLRPETTTTTTTMTPTTTSSTTTFKPRPKTTVLPPTSTTPKPTTTTPTSITTTSTSIPYITTTTTTTAKASSTTQNEPSSTGTSRPKPITIITTTSTPDVPVVQSYLKVLVNSTAYDVCENQDDLKGAIVKLFEGGSGNVRTEDQIKFLNLDERNCKQLDTDKYPVGVELYLTSSNGDFNTHANEEFITLLDNNRLDYKLDVIGVEFLKKMLKNDEINNGEEQNPRLTEAMYLACIAGVCTVLVLILLVVRKRQKRFNYGQRCTPVSLDDYSMDNISVYNSVRRKGAMRASKRSYGNPAFDDPTAVSRQLNFAGLASFSEDRPAIDEEFSNIPVITVKPDELPPDCETKNRYANVIPLPETRVTLAPRPSAGPTADYINANFVKGHKGADRFYIACQAPMQSTVPDFWQMIWEQNTRIIMMVTSLTEKGVEKCADYLPPSEVLDCHRLFGDFQVTLKKREVKEKFIVSSLQLKNLETNLWRDITHLWYGGWPAQGVPSDCSAMLNFLMEARSHMKSNMGPHVVHCSPGTGRTGTVIACDLGIRDFELSRNVDVPKTVYGIRRCRAGAVQTRDQYAFIYKVINLYASKLSGGVLDSI